MKRSLRTQILISWKGYREKKTNSFPLRVGGGAGTDVSAGAKAPSPSQSPATSAAGIVLGKSHHHRHPSVSVPPRRTHRNQAFSSPDQSTRKQTKATTKPSPHLINQLGSKPRRRAPPLPFRCSTDTSPDLISPHAVLR
jgi:hypothetical protein